MVIEEHLDPARDAVEDQNNKDFVDVLLDIQKNEELGFPLLRDGIKAILLVNNRLLSTVRKFLFVSTILKKWYYIWALDFG